jgi:hypothetical protein
MGLIELAHAARLRPIEDLIAEFSAFADTDSAGVTGVGTGAGAYPARPGKPSVPAGMPPSAPAQRNPAPRTPPPAAPLNQSPAPTGTADKPPQKEEDLLEKAKKDPIIRSFMDIFPGPVSAEKIEK